MLSLLLFVALQSRRIYWAEAAPIVAQAAAAPARTPSANVEMPRDEDVKVTGFVPRPDGRGRPLHVKRRVSRSACTGDYNRD